jgi:lysophospholipase L1-like esterase
VSRRLLKLLCSLLISLSFNSTVQAQQQGFFPASASAIYYFGRVQRSPNVLWTWPGTGFRVAFSSSRSISVRFRAPDFPEESTDGRVKLLWYRVDDNPWYLLVLPPRMVIDFPLFAPADRAKHTLSVVKASEGQVIFEGITLEPGGKLAKPAVPPHRIEFVGDSITAGYKIGGDDSFENSLSHDAIATYAWLVGERLNAEVRLIAVTGRGLVHNYGVVLSSSRTIPLYYPYLHRETNLPNDWSWTPEIVVVNIGTNDLGPPEATPSSTFQNAYNNFLSTLRGFNPDALIVALQPFGVANGSVPVYPAEIRAAVEMRRQAGDNRVLYVDTAGWLGARDFTDGAHPNRTGHGKAADKLTPILQGMLATGK